MIILKCMILWIDRMTDGDESKVPKKCPNCDKDRNETPCEHCGYENMQKGGRSSGYSGPSSFVEITSYHVRYPKS